MASSMGGGVLANTMVRACMCAGVIGVVREDGTRACGSLGKHVGVADGGVTDRRHHDRLFITCRSCEQGAAGVAAGVAGRGTQPSGFLVAIEWV